MPFCLFVVLIPAKNFKFFAQDGATKKHSIERIEIDTVAQIHEALSDLNLDLHVDEKEDENIIKLTFIADRDTEAETVIARLEHLGIGQDYGSISMVNLDVHLNSKLSSSIPPSLSINKLKGRETSFKQSVKSRLVVQQLLNGVHDACNLSFDFIMLAFLASIIACCGLVTDSPAVIVASMLVSPIMGPISAIAFGTVLKDWKLVKKAILVELVGLCIILFVGITCGLVFSPFQASLGLPTNEMVTRGGNKWVSLMLGAAIALPSGIGVGLSILNNNTPALVGVAISASLLPPVANTGLLYSHSAFGEDLGGMWVDTYRINDIAYTSFLISIMNIVCIVFGAVLMLKIKEVAPLANKNALFATYIPEVRRQNQVRATEREDSSQAIIDELVRKSMAVQDHQVAPLGSILPAQQTSSVRAEDKIHRSSLLQLLDVRDRDMVQNEGILRHNVRKSMHTIHKRNTKFHSISRSMMKDEYASHPMYYDTNEQGSSCEINPDPILCLG
jgi:uncharacterized hydrophobic protein (TIGR00271 family)